MHNLTRELNIGRINWIESLYLYMWLVGDAPLQHESFVAIIASR